MFIKSCFGLQLFLVSFSLSSGVCIITSMSKVARHWCTDVRPGSQEVVLASFYRHVSHHFPQQFLAVITPNTQLLLFPQVCTDFHTTMLFALSFVNFFLSELPSESSFVPCFPELCHRFPKYNFPGGSGGKASACNAGDLGSIPGLGRSPGEGKGNPLQYSCRENPMYGEPGRLQYMGSQRVGHDWSTSLSLSPSIGTS